MNFLAKVTAAKRIDVSTIYRFVYGVLPLDIKPFYKGSGVYGEGTYFSLDDRSKRGGVYEEDGPFVLHYKYQAQPKNPLLVTKKQVDGLIDADILTVVEPGFLGLKKGEEFEAWDLTKRAKRLGHDSVIITGSKNEDIDGGHQLIALKEFPLKPISLSIRFQSKAPRDAVSKALGDKFKTSTINGTFAILNIPAAFEKRVHSAIKNLEE